MTQDITSLIEKLEGAEAGEVRLDVEIAKSCGYYVPPGPMQGWHDPDGKHIGLPPRFSQSLDAALALAERLELSVGEILNDALEGPVGVGIWQSGWNGTISTIPQIARFVCIAILRAQSEAR